MRGDAHPLDEVAPAADHAGGEAAAHEVLHADVRHVEVGGVDAGVVLFPGEAGFVGAARVERGHIRVEAGHDLDDGEALGGAVGGELLEIVRPVEAPAEPHPPGVGKPEEGNAVGVFEMAAVGRERAVRRGAEGGWRLHREMLRECRCGSGDPRPKGRCRRSSMCSVRARARQNGLAIRCPRPRRRGRGARRRDRGRRRRVRVHRARREGGRR